MLTGTDSTVELAAGGAATLAARGAAVRAAVAADFAAPLSPPKLFKNLFYYL